LNITEWMKGKEWLRAYLVEYGYSADPKIVAKMRDALAAGPDIGGPGLSDTLAMLKAQYPLATWPSETTPPATKP